MNYNYIQLIALKLGNICRTRDKKFIHFSAEKKRLRKPATVSNKKNGDVMLP